jgi:hypothetical protein
MNRPTNTINRLAVHSVPIFVERHSGGVMEINQNPNTITALKAEKFLHCYRHTHSQNHNPKL